MSLIVAQNKSIEKLLLGYIGAEAKKAGIEILRLDVVKIIFYTEYMNKTFIALVIVLSLGALAFLLFKNQGGSPSSPESQPQAQQAISKNDFSNPKKSAHYESNTPEHAAILSGVPINAVIDFNFDLAKGSDIKITKDLPADKTGGTDYAKGETVIDSNNLAMRRKMDTNSPDGLYTISYKACWADGSCHDGQFQFKIDRSIKSEFADMTSQKEVNLNLQNYAFSPAKIKISKGTRVTWVNQDNDVHTVNTDSHPAHTYFLNQNSRDLSKGDTYSVTFTNTGIYLYHCTPHADTMAGQILVE